jgi:hypothetical protein
MKTLKLISLVCAVSVSSLYAQNVEYRDIFSDTWVATDALGRTMPTYEEVGQVKTDKQRVVGIFYITWHSDNMSNNSNDSVYLADVSKILSQDPSARLDAKHPLWTAGMYHWGEPEMGYFLSRDEYVIRHDISMLADAGVDVLIMDVTNAVRYWAEWETLFSVMQQMQAEGNKTPQFCFWAFNGPVITVVQDLFETIYKQDKYRNLWFYWDGKPLLLYNANPAFDANGSVDNPDYKDYTDEVKEFFTLRNMWWGYYEWAGERFVGTEDNWSFGYDLGDKRVRDMNPDELLSLHKGEREEAAVTPAQHAISVIGKSWTRNKGQPKLNEYDMPVPTYVPELGKTVDNPTVYGIYFQERWDEALKSDPRFLYLNDWNEWTAGKYMSGKAPGSELPGPTTFMGRENSFYFVDQYNAEFNRTIQPAKGDCTDNYYMQMAQNIRRYKGIRPLPEYSGFNKIAIDGKFDDWSPVKSFFFDTKGDITHRNYNGYGGWRYVNTSGRNDILAAKVAVDKNNIYFYAETGKAITSHEGNNWMLLLIDADNNNETGWYGYDFLINKNVKNNRKTSVMKYEKSQWKEIMQTGCFYSENHLELSVPRKVMGLTSRSFTFDFKWSDNPANLDNPISLCTDGDTAPNRRFNYRFIFR